MTPRTNKTNSKKAQTGVPEVPANTGEPTTKEKFLNSFREAIAEQQKENIQSTIVSRATAAKSSGNQTPWNAMLNAAMQQGNTQARKDVRIALKVRWQDALSLHNKYVNNKAIGKASWTLRTLYLKYNNLPFNDERWQDLSELVEHPHFTSPIMTRLSDIDLVNLLLGRRGAPGEQHRRGITMFEYKSYGVIAAGVSGYRLYMAGRTLVVDAPTLHNMICAAKAPINPETGELDLENGTFQAVPGDDEAVLYAGKGKISNNYNFYTFVFPAGAKFTDLDGKVWSFPSDIRLSLPHLECSMNYWPVAAIAGRYEGETDQEKERLLLQVKALYECFNVMNNGICQAQNYDQLQWVQAVYCWKLKGDEIFDPGRRYAHMNAEILRDFNQFTQAWAVLEEKKEANRLAGREKAAQGKAASTASIIDGNEGVANDYDPLADVEMPDMTGL